MPEPKADARLISTAPVATPAVEQAADVLGDGLHDDVGSGEIDTVRNEVGPGGFTLQLELGVPFDLWRGEAANSAPVPVWNQLAQGAPRPNDPTDDPLQAAGGIAVKTQRRRKRAPAQVADDEQFEPQFAEPRPAGGRVPWPGLT